jgi:hypothetical protein
LGAFFIAITTPTSSPATDDVSPSLTAISLGGVASTCNEKGKLIEYINSMKIK